MIFISSFAKGKRKKNYQTSKMFIYKFMFQRLNEKRKIVKELN